jgi:hypothetical protein
MSETITPQKPNRASRRVHLTARKGSIRYGCTRCNKPFIAPLAEKCQCPVLRPDELKGQQA